MQVCMTMLVTMKDENGEWRDIVELRQNQDRRISGANEPAMQVDPEADEYSELSPHQRW
jgi:hypothetical protein